MDGRISPSPGFQASRSPIVSLTATAGVLVPMAFRASVGYLRPAAPALRIRLVDGLGTAGEELGAA